MEKLPFSTSGKFKKKYYIPLKVGVVLTGDVKVNLLPIHTKIMTDFVVKNMTEIKGWLIFTKPYEM